MDLRANRLPILLDLLRENALPAEVLLGLLNKALRYKCDPEVSLRTLQHDLDWLRKQLGNNVLEKIRRSELEEPPPAELSHHRWFYRLRGSEDVLPIPDGIAAITEMEALALATARAQLADPMAPGSESEEGPLAEALGRLMRRLGLDDEERVPDVIGIDRFAPQPYDPTHALLCLRAIRTGEALRMSYEGPNSPLKEREVQPIRLVLSEGEPYLWAWDPDTSKLKSYKLSRLRSLTGCVERFDTPAGLPSQVKATVKSGFRGFVDESDRCRVAVRLAREALPYVQGRTLGGAQRWEDLPDGGARIEFNTAGKANVVRWLLPFGALAEIERPEDLRVWMREELEKMAAIYSPSDTESA